MDALKRREIPDHHIHVDLPSVHQQKNFSCGPACLRAISKFFKVGPDTEQKFIDHCNSTFRKGTHPEDLERTAKEYGLQVKAKKNMGIAELKRYLRGGVPVICVMQAWGSEKEYNNSTCGHYVVAIGADGDHIYFMDPLMKSGCRGHLKVSEFVDRWHDYASDGEEYRRFGLAMWRNTTDPKTHKLNVAKEIK